MAHDVNQSELDVAAQARSALITRVSAERCDLWIPESTLWQFESSCLTLTFESDFNCQLAKKMLSQDLSIVLAEILQRPGELVFCVQENAARSSLPAESEQLVAELRSSRVSAASQPIQSSPDGLVVATPAESTRMNASETSERQLHWDGFILGASNQLASATAKLVVADPGKMSPVFIHGPSGSGKSMLVREVAQQLRSVRRLRRVVHMTSEQFTNDFTDGLRGGGLPMFRRKYRDVDALILEDIHFFSGKKSTLTEVKHTLDNLLRLDKQVIFTADRSLNELHNLTPDLINLLRGGLSTPIFPLDEQTRYSILQKQTAAVGVELPDSVCREVAQRVSGDGRVICGIVHRLYATTTLDPQELTWERCWTAIGDLVQATQPVVRMSDIDRVVCSIFGLEPNSLQSQSKMRRVSQPRMLAMFLARKYTPAAYKEIGQYFGHRRHSTVISAEKTVESWLDENSGLDLGRGLSVRDAIRNVESQLHVG